jgi:curved DNA-binding protein CbpA
MKTHYQILGISRHASAVQIRDAYRHGLDALVSAHWYATEDELKIRRLVLREAHHTLSSPVRRQNYDARLEARRIGHDQATQSHAGRRGILWLLIACILALGAYAYVEPQHQAAPVNDTLESMPQGGQARVPVPASDAVHEARSQTRRRQQIRRKMLAEELHAQQQQHPLTTPAIDQIQQSDSGVDRDANPAR